jgi:hypothetical protein
MREWIFQGNRDEFDIDGYLATAPAYFRWLVTRYGDEIAVGDRVYLWRNQGRQKAVAGVIVEAEIIAPTEPRTESPDALPFWRSGASEAATPADRVLLRLVRVAGAREVIRRDWCIEDPVLSRPAEPQDGGGNELSPVAAACRTPCGLVEQNRPRLDSG